MVVHILRLYENINAAVHVLIGRQPYVEAGIYFVSFYYQFTISYYMYLCDSAFNFSFMRMVDRV